MPLYEGNGCWHNSRTVMRLALRLIPFPGFLFLTACVSHPPRSLRQAPADLPGQRPDGSVLLPNQWTLRPVGRQVPLGDFPVNLALHPAGKYGAVLHCGYSAHEIVVVELASGNVASRTKIDEAFYGLTFSKDGSQLFC